VAAELMRTDGRTDGNRIVAAWSFIPLPSHWLRVFFDTDVSGLPVGFIIKGQEVEGRVRQLRLHNAHAMPPLKRRGACT
jgi:hypothetical protein